MLSLSHIVFCKCDAKGTCSDWALHYRFPPPFFATASVNMIMVLFKGVLPAGESWLGFVGFGRAGLKASRCSKHNSHAHSASSHQRSSEDMLFVPEVSSPTLKSLPFSCLWRLGSDLSSIYFMMMILLGFSLQFPRRASMSYIWTQCCYYVSICLEDYTILFYSLV